MANRHASLTGKTLGTCVLGNLLGQGGMGDVYLAQQIRPVRNVAVKVLLPEMRMSDSLYQDFLARFRREANVIARLEHINIMPIYEYGEQDGLAYLVMPYLTGGSLRDLLKQRVYLMLHEAATYLDQAASALDYAHAQGVIHRDLKPANFLLHGDGRLVLADFGIARLIHQENIGSTLTSTGMLVGTPEYMAPEMAKGEAIDYRADIYELGIVLFQMISGHPPFTGDTPISIAIKHLETPLPSLHHLNPGIPLAVDAVVQKATAKERSERYSTARAFAQAFHDAIASVSPSATVEYYHTTPATPMPQEIAILPQPSYTSSAQPTTPPAIPIQYQSYLTPPHVDNASNTYPNPTTPSPYSQPVRPSPRRHTLWLIIAAILILFIISGSFIAVIYLKANSNTTNTTPHITPSVTNPTVTQQPITSTPNTQIPLGTQLYAATVPGPACDTGSGQWVAYNNISVTCQNNTVQLHNPSQGLAGIFLTGIANTSYPANYIVQVQIASSSSADFGVYFRNQPGNQQGVYTFLIHANGTWSSYVYNNTTGAPTQIATGSFGSASTSILLDIVIKGSIFTFYANNHPIGTASDPTYSSGTAGIAVDQGGTVNVSNFALYTVR